MNVTYEKKNAMTFIGYHTEIRPEEGYKKCPEFWDREYAAKYARLWQTMQPETPVEKAILENRIGMYAICSEFRMDWSCTPSLRATGQCSRPGGRFQTLCKR